MNTPQPVTTADSNEPAPTRPFIVAAFWTVVALPLAWGVYHTVLQATQLFH